MSKANEIWPGWDWPELNSWYIKPSHWDNWSDNCVTCANNHTIPHQHNPDGTEKYDLPKEKK